MDDELTEDAIKQITDDVTKVLGPSEKQITGDSILMRTDSDKALVAGETKTMASDGEKLGEGVMGAERHEIRSAEGGDDRARRHGGVRR